MIKFDMYFPPENLESGIVEEIRKRIEETLIGPEYDGISVEALIEAGQTSKVTFLINGIQDQQDQERAMKALSALFQG